MESLEKEITKEEKEKLLSEKIEAMKKRNEMLKKRYEEIEADKKLADKYSASVQISDVKPYVMKPPRPRPEKVYNLPASEEGATEEESTQECILSKQRLLNTDGPPPDPSYRFLADPDRDALIETKASDQREKNDRPDKRGGRNKGRGRGRAEDFEHEFGNDFNNENFRGKARGRGRRGWIDRGKGRGGGWEDFNRIGGGDDSDLRGADIYPNFPEERGRGRGFFQNNRKEGRGRGGYGDGRGGYGDGRGGHGDGRGGHGDGRGGHGDGRGGHGGGRGGHGDGRGGHGDGRGGHGDGRGGHRDSRGRGKRGSFEGNSRGWRERGRGRGKEENGDEESTQNEFAQRFTDGHSHEPRGRGGTVHPRGQRGRHRGRGHQKAYEAWKAERNAIDEARLTRARSGDGEWRREWDMQKRDQELNENENVFIIQFSQGTEQSTRSNQIKEIRDEVQIKDKSNQEKNDSTAGNVGVEKVEKSFNALAIDSNKEQTDGPSRNDCNSPQDLCTVFTSPRENCLNLNKECSALSVIDAEIHKAHQNFYPDSILGNMSGTSSVGNSLENKIPLCQSADYEFSTRTLQEVGNPFDILGPEVGSFSLEHFPGAIFPPVMHQTVTNECSSDLKEQECAAGTPDLELLPLSTQISENYFLGDSFLKFNMSPDNEDAHVEDSSSEVADALSPECTFSSGITEEFILGGIFDYNKGSCSSMGHPNAESDKSSDTSTADHLHRDEGASSGSRSLSRSENLLPSALEDSSGIFESRMDCEETKGLMRREGENLKLLCSDDPQERNAISSNLESQDDDDVAVAEDSVCIATEIEDAINILSDESACTKDGVLKNVTDKNLKMGQVQANDLIDSKVSILEKVKLGGDDEGKLDYDSLSTLKTQNVDYEISLESSKHIECLLEDVHRISCLPVEIISTPLSLNSSLSAQNENALSESNSSNPLQVLHNILDAQNKPVNVTTEALKHNLNTSNSVKTDTNDKNLPISANNVEGQSKINDQQFNNVKGQTRIDDHSDLNSGKVVQSIENSEISAYDGKNLSEGKDAAEVLYASKKQKDETEESSTDEKKVETLDSESVLQSEFKFLKVVPSNRDDGDATDSGSSHKDDIDLKVDVDFLENSQLALMRGSSPVESSEEVSISQSQERTDQICSEPAPTPPLIIDSKSSCSNTSSQNTTTTLTNRSSATKGSTSTKTSGALNKTSSQNKTAKLPVKKTTLTKPIVKSSNSTTALTKTKTKVSPKETVTKISDVMMGTKENKSTKQGTIHRNAPTPLQKVNKAATKSTKTCLKDSSKDSNASPSEKNVRTATSSSSLSTLNRSTGSHKNKPTSSDNAKSSK